MPYKRIKVCGKRYLIVPSLENMCSLESETNTNLISGINPKDINLQFMRATISNLLEDEDGKHISDEDLSRIYEADVGNAQRIFIDCYSQMYHFPTTSKRPSCNTSSKKRKPLRRIFVKRRRDGL